MNHRNPKSLRALLLLLLAVGPLQAQAMYTCAMMDGMVHASCCCDAHSTGDDRVSEKTPSDGEDPCCERSIELSVDEASQKVAGKAAEVRSDPDPPQALIYSIQKVIRPQPIFGSGVRNSSPAARHSRSYTYLITQRLRI